MELSYGAWLAGIPLHRLPSYNDRDYSMLPESRITSIEQRLERGETRMDRYDQMIAEIHRGQDRQGLMISTFIEEMKELKNKDVDISKLVEAHDKVILSQGSQWKMFLSILRWVLTTMVTLGLLIFGAYIAHIL